MTQRSLFLATKAEIYKTDGIECYQVLPDDELEICKATEFNRPCTHRAIAKIHQAYIAYESELTKIRAGQEHMLQLKIASETAQHLKTQVQLPPPTPRPIYKPPTPDQVAARLQAQHDIDELFQD